MLEECIKNSELKPHDEIWRVKDLESSIGGPIRGLISGKLVPEGLLQRSSRGVDEITEKGVSHLKSESLSDVYVQIVKNYRKKLLTFIESLKKGVQDNEIFRKYFQPNGKLNLDIQSKLSPHSYLYCIQNSSADSNQKILWIGVWEKKSDIKFDGSDIVLAELSVKVTDCSYTQVSRYCEGVQC